MSVEVFFRNFILVLITGMLEICMPTFAGAQIPKVGNDTLTELATWNVEWFGDAQNGPSNDALQFANVKDIISQTDIDLWAFCEISNTQSWQALLDELPQYHGTLVTYSQTQKTALIWKKNAFTLLSAQMILTESQYDYDLAGRPPLEVQLIRNDSLMADTLWIYVVHLKAFADQTSFNRRQKAAGYLKAWMDAKHPGSKILIMGDWNDKISGSIYNGSSVSPFLNFVADTGRYRYATQQCVDEGKKSYALSNGSMIDHILYNHTLDSFYVKGQTKVLDMLPQVVSNYTSTTSDHYPVMGRFHFRRYFPVTPNPTTGIQPAIQPNNISVYPNPVHAGGKVEVVQGMKQTTVYDLSGRLMGEFTGNPFEIGIWEPGIYLLSIVLPDGMITYKRLLIR